MACGDVRPRRTAAESNTRQVIDLAARLPLNNGPISRSLSIVRVHWDKRLRQWHLLRGIGLERGGEFTRSISIELDETVRERHRCERAALVGVSGDGARRVPVQNPFSCTHQEATSFFAGAKQ